MILNRGKKLVFLSILNTTILIASSADLGTINVESSTIDNRFESKKTEVSNTNTIDGDTVDKTHAENIQQILQSIPGITTEMQTGDSLKIHIRGVENQMYMGEKPGVAVVIDGVPVFERTGRVNIDLDNIESIKVIKGGASYLFGDDALSGAVIITTKKGAKYNKNYGAIEFGSYGYQKLLARTGGSNENYNFHIQASQKKADGYHEDSDYNAEYLNGKAQYYLNDTSDLTFGMEYSNRQKDSHGTVGGVSEAESNPQSIYNGDMDSRDYTRNYDVELLKLFLTYSKDFSDKSNLLVNTYLYTDDTYFWSSPQTKDATGTSATYTDDDYIYDNYYEQTQAGIKSEYRTSSDSFATLLGVDLRDNIYKNKVLYRADQKVGYGASATYPQSGDVKSNDTTNENVYALYGEYKQSITKDFTTTANIRYDTIKLDYTDSLDNDLEKSFDIYSYRIGANYKISKKNILFTNYSTGFRAPTIKQLFAGSVSTWGSTQNNTDLKPEKSYNYEVGLRGYVDKMSYEVAIFDIKREDFIMSTSGNYGDTNTTEIYDNIGGAEHKGLELFIKNKTSDQFSYSFAYTYLDAKYTDYKNFGIDLGGTLYTYDVTGNTIPRTSKHTANLILEYKPKDNILFSSEFVKKSSYYADDLNTLKIEGQESINILVEYKTKLSKNILKLFTRVDNILDNQYFNTARASGDRDENGVFDEEDLSITVNQGRTYTAGLSLKF